MDRNKTFNLVFSLVIVLSVALFVFIIPALLEEGESGDSGETVGRAKAGGLWFESGGKDQGDVKLEDNLLVKNYYIIFDGSGSMQDDEKLPTAKKALIRFVSYVPDTAKLGLAIFDGHGLSERVALGNDRQGFINQVNQTSAEGNTPLKEALLLAYSKLTEQARKQLGYGEYNIVVVTDGEASPGHEPDRVVNSILANSPVVIYTIGFHIGEDHSLNQPGRIFYRSAKNLEELSQGLEEVLAESESFVITDFNK